MHKYARTQRNVTKIELFQLVCESMYAYEILYKHKHVEEMLGQTEDTFRAKSSTKNVNIQSEYVSY